jgi:GTP-binding protein EngB required for normal cell division
MAWVTPKFDNIFNILLTKADKISDSELINMLAEESIIDPLSNTNNEIYTDKNGKIYVL